jgi:hypothetical protein
MLLPQWIIRDGFNKKWSASVAISVSYTTSGPAEMAKITVSKSVDHYMSKAGKRNYSIHKSVNNKFAWMGEPDIITT